MQFDGIMNELKTAAMKSKNVGLSLLYDNFFKRRNYQPQNVLMMNTFKRCNFT